MEIIGVIVLIVLWIIIWSKPNLTMIFSSIVLTLFVIALDVLCIMLLSYNRIFGGLPAMVNLTVITIMILPWIFLIDYLKATIKILYYNFNKEKILTEGQIEKGIIQKIKSYGYRRGYKSGYYLIVEFYDEKIRSFYFKNNSEKEKTIVYNSRKEKWSMFKVENTQCCQYF